ncbi:MAG: urease accessory protein UreJ [Nitrosomonadaceae bacterium]|nr:MAG: urease accessory protein UreJ [Nitrosomonadaceae bacterium]
MRTNLTRWCIALSAVTFCSIADAHPGHTNGAMAGIIHPFLGLDHLLAMLAVGVWAAQLGGRARWLVPVSFVTLMALAGGIGMVGIVMPMIESGIATSVLLLGLLIAFSIKVTPAAGACIVSFFAVFHGYAHGVEMPQFVTPWQYGSGFVLSTAALHGFGLLLGRSLHRRGLWLRATGTLVAVSGTWMVAAI